MKRKHFIQRLTMPLSELECYYRGRWKERFENNEPIRGEKAHHVLHPVLLGGIKIIHLFKKQKVTIIRDKRISTDRSIIFAATHIGWDDVEMIFSAIGSHAYLFWGDSRESYKTLDGCLLDLNGAIICDTDHKMDRHIGKETCVHWLEQGGNLLIFPEGVWNFSENKLVMYLFNGTAEMAIRTGADIVPVAIMQFDKEFRVNIGRNIDGGNWHSDQKQALTDYLRDVLATLKWELYETQSITERKSIPENASERYRQYFIDQSKGVYSWQDFISAAFRPANIASPEDVFVHLNKLIPNRENAFLFRKSNMQNEKISTFVDY